MPVDASGTEIVTLYLSKGWVQALLALILATIGIIFSAMLSRGSRAFTELRVLVAEGTVLSPAKNTSLATSLEICFNGQIVPQVTRTTIAIWNSGTQTVLGSQIVALEPLKAVYEQEARVLQSTVIGVTRPAIDAKVQASDADNEALMKFDYLDPGDGFVVEIIQSARLGQLKITGTLRGMPKGLTAHLTPIDRVWSKRRLTIIAFWIIFSWAIGILWIINIESWSKLTLFSVIVFGIQNGFIADFVDRQDRIIRKMRAVPALVRSNAELASTVQRWRLFQTGD